MLLLRGMGIGTLLFMFSVATSQYELPSGLLASLCFVESRHNPKAIHEYDGETTSFGICQIKLSTARFVGFKGTEKELMMPQTNIKYAAKYLRYQLTRYKNDVQKAVAAYNAGSYRPGKNNNPINHLYVKKVFYAWSKL